MVIVVAIATDGIREMNSAATPTRLRLVVLLDQPCFAIGFASVQR
jgi:hypothetical protein